MQCSHPAKKRQAGRAAGHPELSQQSLPPLCPYNRSTGSWVPSGDCWPRAHTHCKHNRPRNSLLPYGVLQSLVGPYCTGQCNYSRNGTWTWVTQNRMSPASCLRALTAGHGTLGCLQAPPISIWPKLHGSVPRTPPQTQGTLCTHSRLSTLPALHHRAEAARC